ncbi:hypothetical protein ACFLIM_42450 [Nonomuraea sp. M3C6]|uniref:C2H2-type domain-containing protein n=1 Tax=Nonomuraea marmarensis TaxID=3351344 RepID=A0ABW7AR21_9ACTN
MSAAKLARCQCPTRTAELRACHRTATAEDLRCDICRFGCRATLVAGEHLVPHAASLDYRPPRHSAYEQRWRH